MAEKGSRAGKARPAVIKLLGSDGKEGKGRNAHRSLAVEVWGILRYYSIILWKDNI